MRSANRQTKQTNIRAVGQTNNPKGDLRYSNPRRKEGERSQEVKGERSQEVKAGEAKQKQAWEGTACTPCEKDARACSDTYT